MTFFGLKELGGLVGRQDRRGCTPKQGYRPSFERLEQRVLLSPQIVEFAGIPQQRFPMGITAGPDGNLWFANEDSIGKINPSTGEIQDYVFVGYFLRITSGPDGNLWFVTNGTVGSFNPTTGSARQFPLPVAPGGSIITGPDGNVWFTELDGIGRINPNTDVIESFGRSTLLGHPDGITLGPDGNLWFSETVAIGMINPFSGVIKEYPTSLHNQPVTYLTPMDNNYGYGFRVFGWDPGNLPQGEIVTGSDGNLWYITGGNYWYITGGNYLAGINPTSGAFMDLALPPGVFPEGITTGSDGNIWFTEHGGGIGWVNPVTGASEVYNQFLPGTANPDEITFGPDGNVWFTRTFEIDELVRDRPLVGTGETITGFAGSQFKGVVASFVDKDSSPGTPGAYSATIDWGDGTSSPGVIGTNGSGGFLIAAAHTYLASGSFSIKVTIADHDTSHDFGSSMTMVVSSASIGGLNIIGVQTSNGSSASVLESSGAVNQPGVGELQLLSKSPAVFSPGTTQPTTDSGSRGMGGVVAAEDQTGNSLDPILELPTTSVQEPANNPGEVLDRPQKAEAAPAVFVPSVFEYEATADAPMTIWNRPCDHFFDEPSSALSSGELASSHTMTDGPTTSTVDFHFPGSMIMLLSLSSGLQVTSEDKQAGLTALRHRKRTRRAKQIRQR